MTGVSMQPGEADTGKAFPRPVLAFKNITLLDASEFNPNIRIEGKNITNLKRDVLGCQRIVSPILVVPSKGERFIVGDGHRRVEVARLLVRQLLKEARDAEESGDKAVAKEKKLLADEFAQMPCAIYNDGVTPADLYLRQFTSRRPSGNEAVRVWLIKPEAVPMRVRVLMHHVEALVPRARIKEYAEGHWKTHSGKTELFPCASTEAFQIGFRIARQLGYEWKCKAKEWGPQALDPRNPDHVEFAATLFDWLVFGKQRLAASKWLTRGGSLAELRSAILHNTPLQVKMGLGKGRAVPK